MTSSVKAKAETAMTTSSRIRRTKPRSFKGYSMDWMNDPSAFAGGQVPQTKRWTMHGRWILGGSNCSQGSSFFIFDLVISTLTYTHKQNWKVRSKAYDEFKTRVESGDDLKSDELSACVALFPKMTKDTNAAAFKSSVQAVRHFFLSICT